MDNLSPERWLRPASLVWQRVAGFIAAAAFLGIAQALLVITLPPGALPPLPPSFVPGIVAFCLGVTLSVALLAFGRFLSVRESYAFWLGTAFWLSSLVAASYLLALQGFLPNAASISPYLFYFFFLVLLLPCLSFITLSSGPGPSHAGWPFLGGASLVCVLLIWALVAYSEHLRPIFLAPRPDQVSSSLPYVFLLLYLVGIGLHWREFHHTQEPLVGYFLGFLSVTLWTFSAVIHSYTVHDLSSLSYFLFPAAGAAAFYFALLLGYLDLYRGLAGTLSQMALTHRLNALVTGSLDLKEIYRTLSEEIRKLVPYDRMTISIFQNAGRYRTVFDQGIPRSETGDPMAWIREGSAMQWIVEHREPVICEDLLQDHRFPGTRKRYEGLGVRSFMIFPLMVKGRVLGALNLASLTPGSYGKKDPGILAPVVEVLSLAVENATLYQEAKRREEMQRILKEVSQEITSSDLDSLLKKFTDRVREILKVDLSDVRFIERGIQHIVGISGVDAERFQTATTLSGRGASQWIMENRKPLAIPDITLSQEVRIGETTRGLGVRGYLRVPFFSRDGEVMGSIRALTYEPRHFSQEEIDLLQQLANGVAIALENGRLLDDLKSANQKLEQFAKDQQTMRELLSDILLLELDELLQKMTEQAASLFQAEFAWLRLLDEDSTIKTRAIAGDAEIARIIGSSDIGRRQGRARQVLEGGKPVTVKDMALDPGFPYHSAIKAAGLHGFLGAPLFSKDKKPLGLLFVCTRAAREFSQRELSLIQQFANGAAIAIENAALFNEARKKSGELELAYQAKSDFLNTMAHELRTPLNVIIGTEQLVTDGFFGNLTEGQRKGLEPLARSAEDLLHLINGILDLARLEAGRVPLRVEEFGVGGLLEELAASFAPLAREKGLGLKFGAANGMKLRSDRSKVKEVLQNLLGNAVKYTDGGEVGIGVEAGSDGRVVISVEDTGIGMKAEELGRIFEPFYMVEGVDRRKYPGSGLGLSIVKRMVELLGGEITVESEWGKGSTFKINLPSLS